MQKKKVVTNNETYHKISVPCSCFFYDKWLLIKKKLTYERSDGAACECVKVFCGLTLLSSTGFAYNLDKN